MHVTQEKIDMIKADRASGMSAAAIQYKYGIARSTYFKWVEKYIVNGEKVHDVEYEFIKAADKKKPRPIVKINDTTVDCDKVFKTCIYGCRGIAGKCNYLDIAGHSRGCPHKECNVYQRKVKK